MRFSPPPSGLATGSGLPSIERGCPRRSKRQSRDDRTLPSTPFRHGELASLRSCSISSHARCISFHERVAPNQPSRRSKRFGRYCDAAIPSGTRPTKREARRAYSPRSRQAWTLRQACIARGANARRACHFSPGLCSLAGAVGLRSAARATLSADGLGPRCVAGTAS